MKPRNRIVKGKDGKVYFKYRSAISGLAYLHEQKSKKETMLAERDREVAQLYRKIADYDLNTLLEDIAQLDRFIGQLKERAEAEAKELERMEV
jgi:hypothetical protein